MNRYPLVWPAGWPRTPPYQRARSVLSKRTLASIRDDVLAELVRMRVEACVVSSDVPLRIDGLMRADAIPPQDPGVAVYWTDRKKRDMVLACDRWNTVNANLRAIGLTIAALRGIERWGSSEMLDRSFGGYQQLPAPGQTSVNGSPWWSVLGVEPLDPAELLVSRYRELLKATHPDKVGGSAEAFSRVRSAYAAARQARPSLPEIA